MSSRRGNYSASQTLPQAQVQRNQLMEAQTAQANPPTQPSEQVGQPGQASGTYGGQNVPYEQQNVPYEQQNVPYKQQNVPYEQQNVPYKQQDGPYGLQNTLPPTAPTQGAALAQPMTCPYHRNQVVLPGAGMPPMGRFLAEGPTEQPAIFNP
ncbi:hypothetical protein FGG08_003735, partial [Glutinoglossum americanum]